MMAGLAERCRWKSIRPIVFPRPPPVPMRLKLFRIRKLSIAIRLLDLADDGVASTSPPHQSGKTKVSFAV
jgi:hypothetical protein